MRVPHTIGWGIALALATAIISGFSVYLNGRFVKLFDDPTLLAAVRNGLVGLALVGIAVGAGTLPAIRRLSGRERMGLLAIGIIGGGIPFALFFEGLALSSSPAAAVIHKTLFLWVAVLAVPFLGERLGRAPDRGARPAPHRHGDARPGGFDRHRPRRAHDPGGDAGAGPSKSSSPAGCCADASRPRLRRPPG